MDQLIKAVIANNVEKLRECLQQGQDPNGYEDSAQLRPLHFAAQHGSLESAELLLLAGADFEVKNADGITPIEVARLHNQQRIVELLQCGTPLVTEH